MALRLQASKPPFRVVFSVGQEIVVFVARRHVIFGMSLLAERFYHAKGSAVSARSMRG